jgi:hypothetical protein
LHKFYRFLLFFGKFGPSIEPEKASLKSASTPYPPQKEKFIGIFNNLRPNLADEPFLIKILIYNYTFLFKIC